MTDLLAKLEGGDRRSIGRVDEVVAEVLADPTLFNSLFKGILGKDTLIRMRAADAVEKISAQRPEYLAPYKTALIQQVAPIEQQEVRWHFAQIIPRLQLEPSERAAVVEILLDHLGDKSKIVQTMSLQALADLTAEEQALRNRVIPLLEKAVQTGSPALQSRGRKLLAQLKNASPDE